MCDVFMVSIRFCLLFPSSRRMLIAESVHTVMLSPLFNVGIAFLHAPCIVHSFPLLLVATVAPIVSPSLFPCSIPQANVTMSVSSVAVAGMIAPPKPAISAAFWFLSLGPAPSVNAQKWVFFFKVAQGLLSKRRWLLLQVSLYHFFLKAPRTRTHTSTWGPYIGSDRDIPASCAYG